MENPAVEMVGVDLRRDGRTVLRGIDLRIPARGITVVVGPSGSGKSSLLRLINRLDAPETGTIRVLGEDIAAADPRVLRRRVGMVFQRPVPFPGSVRDNLRVGAPSATDEILRDLLIRGGLDATLLAREATELSGGEAQRMCLARTLSTEPSLLLLDEPTSALDAEAAAVVERTGRSLAEGGIPLIWVTHDPRQARRLADHAVRVVDGRIAAAGAPSVVLGDGDDGEDAANGR